MTNGRADCRYCSFVLDYARNMGEEDETWNSPPFYTDYWKKQLSCETEMRPDWNIYSAAGLLFGECFLTACLFSCQSVHFIKKMMFTISTKQWTAAENCSICFVAMCFPGIRIRNVNALQVSNIFLVQCLI